MLTYTGIYLVNLVIYKSNGFVCIKLYFSNTKEIAAETNNAHGISDKQLLAVFRFTVNTSYLLGDLLYFIKALIANRIIVYMDVTELHASAYDKSNYDSIESVIKQLKGSTTLGIYLYNFDSALIKAIKTLLDSNDIKYTTNKRSYRSRSSNEFIKYTLLHTYDCSVKLVIELVLLVLKYYK